jgi:hypothetical protein
MCCLHLFSESFLTSHGEGCSGNRTRSPYLPHDATTNLAPISQANSAPSGVAERLPCTGLMQFLSGCGYSRLHNRISTRLLSKLEDAHPLTPVNGCVLRCGKYCAIRSWGPSSKVCHLSSVKQSMNNTHLLRSPITAAFAQGQCNCRSGSYY